MSTSKTHWKKLMNPNYIGAYSLEEGKDLTVEIVKVVREIVKGENGKSDECTVAYLAGQKPLILNVTNNKTISKLYGTPFIEDWVGKKITLYVSNTKLKGEEVECLRIRDKMPTENRKPILDKSNPNWNKAVQAVKSGNYKIEDLRAKYEIGAEAEKLLTV